MGIGLGKEEEKSWNLEKNSLFFLLCTPFSLLSLSLAQLTRLNGEATGISIRFSERGGERDLSMGGQEEEEEEDCTIKILCLTLSTAKNRRGVNGNGGEMERVE